MTISMAVVAYSIFFMFSFFYGVLKPEAISFGFMIAIWGILSFRLLQKEYRSLQTPAVIS